MTNAVIENYETECENINYFTDYKRSFSEELIFNIKKIGYRIYQKVLQVTSYFVDWHRPNLIEGKDSILQLPNYIKDLGLSNVLIITDKVLRNLGLLDNLINELKKENIQFSIFDDILPNPTVDMVEKALVVYKNSSCQGIIAFGGGSPIDNAKAVGARVVQPKKELLKMKGVLKVKKTLPPIFAVPTTAGTGSEATIAAVISDPVEKVKYQIDDIVLIPHTAVLDPVLTLNLPPHITSTTGMDALTHAIESFIGKSNTEETKKLSRAAVCLIFNNIHFAYGDKDNIVARGNMLKASHYAGIAFTRAYIGYVHAMAHALGGKYNTPHGLANAIILPYVLEYYGASVYSKLAELADLTGVSLAGDSKKNKALKFIESIKKLNRDLNIPDKIEIDEEDIDELVNHVLKEANPFYPVPKILGKEDITNLFYLIKK